ncbi:MAG: metalloregulator ArsR/SmtB family transcription factor [Terracidiphilus sp.]|jgi:DNA-binding transcriptional ArsR family regulator
MARARTTSDAFNAVAEPRRRQILLYLAHDERQVGEIVTAIGLDQPSVSKHLGVLRRVNLVRVRRNGRHRLYRTNAAAIQPLHQWTETFERYWQHQLNRVKERAERVQAEIDREGNPSRSTIPKH